MLDDGVKPVHALLGGLIIGSSVLWSARLLGKVTGISGAMRRATTPRSTEDVAGSRALLGGLLVSGVVARLALGEKVLTGILSRESAAVVWDMVPRQFVGGLLVGIGTTLANGCTSGHGVCGLGRLSVRSLVAVLTFMGVASVTATATGTLSFLRAHHPWSGFLFPQRSAIAVGGPAALAIILAPAIIQAAGKVLRIAPLENLTEVAVRAITGLTFGTGLILSKMADPAVVAGFLVGPWSQGFDPTLLGVLGGAVAVSVFAFRGNRAPSRQVIDAKLIAGSATFGAGWGLIGMCPGPAVVSVGLSLFQNPAVNSAVLGMLAGSQIVSQK